MIEYQASATSPRQSFEQKLEVEIVSQNQCKIQFTKALSAALNVTFEYQDIGEWAKLPRKMSDLITPSGTCDAVKYTLLENVNGQWVDSTSRDTSKLSQKAYIEKSTTGSELFFQGNKLAAMKLKLVASSSSAAAPVEQEINIDVSCDYKSVKELSSTPLKITASSFTGDSNNLLAIGEQIQTLFVGGQTCARKILKFRL